VNQPSSRHEQAWNQRQQGLTLRAIGIFMSLSPGRIRQMVYKWERWIKFKREQNDRPF
jgi:hypothetical protein